MKEKFGSVPSFASFSNCENGAKFVSNLSFSRDM